MSQAGQLSEVSARQSVSLRGEVGQRADTRRSLLTGIPSFMASPLPSSHFADEETAPGRSLVRRG